MVNQKGFEYIPSMDVLLSEARAIRMSDRLSRGEVKMALQEIIAEVRSAILSGSIAPSSDLSDEILDRLEARVGSGRISTLRRVVNATGVIIHTNLGRSLLSRRAIDAMLAVSRGYCTLEYDLDEGRRGSRHIHCEKLIKRITGAEAALVVNNNASAVTLILNTFSNGKEAIVSRGELVEIGGSFRMPDIMSKSGARMVEVGTTNKTRLSDYRDAVTEDTGIIAKVHRSNFKITGFVDETSLEELASLCRDVSVPLLYDQGSGLVMALDEYGVDEETVRESLGKGASIVCFSGDKMLGGPQAGIISGEKRYLDEVRSNPLTRTYRVDKFTLAALEATLKLYLEPANALSEIPVLRMLSAPRQELEKRGEAILKRLNQPSDARIALREVTSEVGGGSLPSTEIPSMALVIEQTDRSANDLERMAREWSPPIIGRIRKGSFILDLRTVVPEDDTTIVSFLASLT